MDEAIIQVYPKARVIMYADDVVVFHEDRKVLEHCQQLLVTWLAKIGLTLNEAKSHIHHTLEGDQAGFDWLGFNIRQYRVGKHQSGKFSNGQRRGFKTLIKPAKVNMAAHLAELARIIRRGNALPQGALIHQLNPKIRGWATYYRTSVSQAAFDRLDFLTWEKLRSWARRRHPRKNRGLGAKTLLASRGQPHGVCDCCHRSRYRSPADAQRGPDHTACQGERKPQPVRWQLGVLEYATRTASRRQSKTSPVAQEATRALSLLWAVLPT